MNEIDKDIYIKYGQLNIKNNSKISKINNIEVNNNVDNIVYFSKMKELSPYCDITYNLLRTKTKTNEIVPYNEYLNINDYCNK
jgi:hypothetical protein